MIKALILENLLYYWRFTLERLVEMINKYIKCFVCVVEGVGIARVY